MPASQPRLLGPAASQRLFLLAVGAVLVASAAATMLSGFNPALAVAPVAAVGAAWFLGRAQLRWSAAVLLVLVLVPDDQLEAVGQWRTPFAVIGDLVHYRLDAVTGLPGAAVTGMEVLLLFMAAVWLRRKLQGSTVDATGAVPPAPPLRSFLLLYVAGVLASEAFGLARGLQVAPWKLRNLLHPIALALLFLAAFRAPGDQRMLGRLVVWAACLRSVLAIAVQRFAIRDTGGMYDWATSHGDAILSSVALFLVAGHALALPTRRRLLQGALLSGLILWGAEANNRRIFWVMVGLTVVAAYLVSPMRGWKLGLTRFLVVAAPALALYVAVGWNRSTAPFGPVQTIRGLVDTQANRSSYWREVENWNIAMSIRQFPITGIGLGGEYTEIMPNDDVSVHYKEYREWPHNTFLGLLLLMGPLGFTAIQALMGFVVFLGFRSYARARSGEDRVAAFGCIAAIIACQVMAWGDLGSRFPQYKALAALAIVVASRLAVATGAWPGRRAAAAEPI